MALIDRGDYAVIDSGLFNAHYLTIDIGTPNDSTVALLVNRVDTYGNNLIYDDDARTESPIIHTRYNVIGCRHLSPALSYDQQAQQIAKMIEPLEVTVRTTVNISEIGAPAARAFRQFKPEYFKFDEKRSPEFLRSLIIAALNTEPVQLRLADDVECRADDLDTERCGDARAVGITLHRNATRTIREPLTHW